MRGFKDHKRYHLNEQDLQYVLHLYLGDSQILPLKNKFQRQEYQLEQFQHDSLR